MQTFTAFLTAIHQFLWGAPMLLLLLGTHLYFTLRLGFIQKRIPTGIRMSLQSYGSEKGGISPFAALSTALAATIGTGNIIGVSAAIKTGGFGAVFWCWVSGILGIATCYGECFLSVRYRSREKNGTNSGGPMYILDNVLGHRGLSVFFCLSAICASFGIGSSVQSKSICTAIRTLLPVSPHLIGITAAVLSGFVLLGGIRQISKICTYLVPFMSLFYIGGCAYLLWHNRDCILPAIRLIVKNAFQPMSVISGISSGGLLLSFRIGILRGLFTNEAGLGSIPMAAAATNLSSPQKQGLISMTGVFWDTVVICAVTGLVIVCCLIKNPLPLENVGADRLCFLAFDQIPFVGSGVLSVSLVLFAFATILGWCYYGECSMRYLFREKGIRYYRFLYILSVYLGAVLSLELVWKLSDLFNSLMILPNLYCLWALRNTVISESKSLPGIKKPSG